MADTFHVLAILDGNRRFAKKNNLLSWKGHQVGYETFKNILPAVWEHGVTHFTAWVLSMNNVLNRPKIELSFLYKLLDHALKELDVELAKKDHDIQFHAVGEWNKIFSEQTKERIQMLEERTASCKKGVLTLLLAYDGKKDFMDAINRSRFLPMNSSFPTNTSCPITEELIKKYLSIGYLPDIDLVVRTGGEPHLSEGLPLWQMANAYLYFTETLWPEFTKEELVEAIQQFKRCERRHGA